MAQPPLVLLQLLLGLAAAWVRSLALLSASRREVRRTAVTATKAMPSL